MTIESMLSRLHKDKVRVKLMNGEYSWSAGWECDLYIYREGITLSVTEQGATYDEALSRSYMKFYKIAEHGAGDLIAPVIEHRKPNFGPDGQVPNDKPRSASADEIPF
jgi:hypothetical protein